MVNYSVLKARGTQHHGLPIEGCLHRVGRVSTDAPNIFSRRLSERLAPRLPPQRQPRRLLPKNLPEDFPFKGYHKDSNQRISPKTSPLKTLSQDFPARKLPSISCACLHVSSLLIVLYILVIFVRFYPWLKRINYTHLWNNRQCIAQPAQLSSSICPSHITALIFSPNQV